MRFFFIIVFTFISLCVSAQQPKVMNNPEYDDKIIHFGFSLGLNDMSFNIRRTSNFVKSDSLHADIFQLSPGFQVSVISDLRLGKYFNLRCLPGINFGQRTINFVKDNQIVTSMKLESNFIDFPLTFKYRAKRVNNYAPYLIAGSCVRFDLASRDQYDSESQVYIRLKPFDYYIETGFGIDYYLYYFKFSTEIKFALGLRDVLVHDPAPGEAQYVNAINRLTSKIVMLSFHFE